MHLGQGLSRHRPPTSQYTGGATARLTHGDYKSGGSREVTKLLDRESPGKLRMAWLLNGYYVISYEETLTLPRWRTLPPTQET